MLPGRKFTPEDVLAILRRRYWLILVPFALVSAATAVYARRLPDRYRSDTLIAVIPPRVPEGIVRNAVNTRIEDRLPAVQQQILSRTRLERIIQDLNLYTDERRTGIMEDIVDQMRRAISVDIVRGDAFRVGFTSGDARTAMRVAERVSSLFIEESLRDREVLVEGTDQFLESQVEEAKRRLIETEKKREEYRRRFAGELPTQIDANLQGVQNRQLQIQALLGAVDRDQERRLNLERLLADLETQTPSESAAVLTAAGGTGTTAQQLNAARARLTEMRLVLKADHPDVRQITRVISDLEKKLEEEALQAPVSAAGSAGGSPAEQLRQRRMAEIRGQLEQLDRQTARSMQEVETLRKDAAEYQRRAESGPTRETEMVELNRDYNTLQGIYGSLLGKKEEANIAANLERRQIGEQFKILDPARIPQRPFSPNRQRLNLMGMGAGLGIGVLLVGLLEYRNNALDTDDDVAAVLSLPVLAVVPLMESDAERVKRRKYRLVLGAGLGGTVLGCLAILVYTFVR